MVSLFQPIDGHFLACLHIGKPIFAVKQNDLQVQPVVGTVRSADPTVRAFTSVHHQCGELQSWSYPSLSTSIYLYIIKMET